MVLDIHEFEGEGDEYGDWPAVFAVACRDCSIEFDPKKEIEEVIASIDGSPDDRDWQAVVKLKGGRFAWVSSGCDYSGWGCQDWGTIQFANSLETLLSPLYSKIWLDEELVEA